MSSYRNAGGTPARFSFRPPLTLAGAPPMSPYRPPPMPHGAVPFVAPVQRFPPQPYAAVPYYDGPVRTPPLAAAMSVEMRSVMAHNFKAELGMIRALLPLFPILVVDTEYPGAVHRPPDGKCESQLTADERYDLVRDNVNEVSIVQLGLTICDAQGNLPRGMSFDMTGRPVELAWEFTFSDFDMHSDRHAPESVEFLRSQGLNFDLARAAGVSSAAFRDKLLRILNTARRDELTWVAFGGPYDFAYLLKMFSYGRPLPETRMDFLAQVRELLGGRVFDAKYMAENCGRGDLRGVGLSGVAMNLAVPQYEPDPPCLAGPKSLTASRVFQLIRKQVFNLDGGACHEGFIDGLH